MLYWMTINEAGLPNWMTFNLAELPTGLMTFNLAKHLTGWFINLAELCTYLF